MTATQAIRSAFAAWAMLAALTPGIAQQRDIAVSALNEIVRQHPLPAGETAAIVATFAAGDNELGVLVMSRNRLHHHALQDHVLFVARGQGLARLEDGQGRIERRAIKPGDILVLPRMKKHAFEKTGETDLVFLVLAGPGRDDYADTTFHE